MRTLTAQPPTPATIIDRDLVQQLSRAAALADRILAGPPSDRARRIHYERRHQEAEREARRELRALRDALAMLELQ